MAHQREQPTFEEYLKRHARQKKEAARAGEEPRVQVSAALTRRYRAETVSDRFGRFSPNGTGRWLDDTLGDEQRDLLHSLHFLPVVEPAVSANLAAMVTAKVRVTFEAASKDPAAGGVVSVCESVAAYLDGHEEHWSDGLEAEINLLSQLSFGYFIRSRHNPHKRGEKVKETEWGEGEVPTPGEFACPECNAGGPFFEGAEQDPASGMAVVACPECGGPAEVVEEPGADSIPVPAGERERNAGAPETLVFPMYQCRVDERTAKGGDLRRAKWFEFSELLTEDEMLEQNPGFECEAPAEWDYAIKWLRALETGETRHLSKFDPECKVYQRRNVCLTPDEYRAYRVPAGGGYRLAGPDGQVFFEIREGERLVDRFPDGLLFQVEGERLLPGSPEEPGVRPYVFADEWCYGGFRPDPFSFWMRPQVSLLDLQDDVVTLYTLDHQHRARAAKTNLVYDQQAFDPEAFDYDEVPTKDGFALEQGSDIRRHYAVVESPRMQLALEGLSFLYGIMPQAGAAPPVAMGAPDDTEKTFAGQKLKHQRSMMMLAPSQESKAKAKKAFVRNHLKIAQKHWPDEAFTYLRSRLGAEWKAEDVAAFREADLDRVVKIDHAEGSEVPTTFAEREQKMGALLVQLFEAVPQLAQAGEFEQDLRELLSQYADLAGIEYDFGDTEGDRRLAQARYDRVREGLERCRTEDDVFVLMSHPQLFPLSKENARAAVEFWSDKARAALAAAEPDILLVALCDEMIVRHEQAAAEGMAHRAAVEAYAAQPLRQAESEAGAAQAAADAERAGAESEAARAEKDSERQAAREDKEADRAEREREREHEASLKGAEMAHQAEMAERQAAARASQGRGA